MLAVSQEVGNFTIIRQLGAGGMGIVFEAQHRTIGRRAAIKVLHPHLSSNPQLAQRFLNEARAVNLIRHPGFVEIFEFGSLPQGSTYIVMEFLEGESLRKRLRRWPPQLPVDWTLALARQLSSAFIAAHERGVVHRDLKPENLMLIPDAEGPEQERVKILDLGIAKLLTPQTAGESGDLHTQTGVAMGTPHYMSPEQCLGSTQVDGKADVYALGVILFECLAGRRPFEAMAALELMTLHVQTMPPSLSAFRRDLPAALVGLVEQLLAKQPGERPSMQAVWETVVRMSAASALRSPPNGLLPAGVVSSEAGAAVPYAMTETPARASKLPSSPNSPFIAGPPISDPNRFIGRERELKRLCSLWRQTPLQNAAIIGKPRSGKTSLLLYLKNVLARPAIAKKIPEYLLALSGRQFVYVDFQDPRMGTPDGLLRFLLTGMKLTSPSMCTLDRFMDIVAAELRTPTIILFDEIGVAIERYAALDAIFWEGLRALATNQVEGRLGFLLSSHHSPHELAETALGGSPFFNIFGYTTTLGPLREPEARALIALSPLPFSEADSRWMMDQSRCFPLLLQILCRERLSALQDGDEGEDWKQEALRQIEPFARLLS